MDTDWKDAMTRDEQMEAAVYDFVTHAPPLSLVQSFERGWKAADATLSEDVRALAEYVKSHPYAPYTLVAIANRILKGEA